MTDLIERRKRKGRKPLRHGEDFAIIYERNRETNKKKRLPIADTHIDGA
jgi:hypothetical protein